MESAREQKGGSPSQIISWRRMKDAGDVAAMRTALPEWAPEAFEQVLSVVSREEFPCIFARRSVQLRSGWVCFAESVESTEERRAIREAILSYFAVLRGTPRERSIIMPLMLIVRPVRPRLSLGAYRDQAWGLFQYLHDNDPEPWPSDVPTDPERGDWTFCFSGTQFFANVSCPAHEVHTSRNLGDALVFAMQPRTNFDVVGGNNPKGRQVRAEIRARAERYEGHRIPSHLGFYGTPENREWLQMATKDCDADTGFPATCPFKFNATKRRVRE